jgi:phosphonatase-like hydrolase
VNAELVVFDLGGTTIHDRGDVPASFAGALENSGIPFEAREIDQWRGASKREVLARLVERRGLDPALAEAAYTEFRSSLKDRLSASSELAFPVSAPTFGKLRDHGVRLALNSGFDRDIVSLVLASARWDLDWFDAIVCSEDVSQGRPAPDMILRGMEIAGIRDPARVAVVGDTRLDLEAALRAGAAWRIGVLSGAHDRATLERAPSTHVVPDITSVPSIVCPEIPGRSASGR